MTFAKAIQAQETTTTNGMKAYESTTDYCVDLFGKIAASRGQDIIPSFIKAYDQNREIALKIAQWARDVRGGAGERQVFKDILKYLETKNIDDAKLLALNAPNIGRFDDILEFETQEMKDFVFEIFKTALQNESTSKLCAKWAPSESKANKALAREFIKYLGVTPKFYRKMLVNLKQVVETQMCAKEFESIKFDHVPSVAMARYRKAFYKNAPEAFPKYIESVTKGEVKINASAVFPHDVIRDVFTTGTFSKAAEAQWNALPNYVGDAAILPVVDVSGSMDTKISGSIAALHVSVSLGLYLSDKNKGAFHGCFVNFSDNAKVQLLKGSISDKFRQLNASDWEMSTNIEAVFDTVLKMAKNQKVSQEDMPKYIMIMSDMQFNQCVRGYDESALEMMTRMYKEAGYELPKIIFWNLNDHGNTPVRFDDKGTAFVSGYSPAILKSILKANLEKFTPQSVMFDAISDPRYVA